MFKQIPLFGFLAVSLLVQCQTPPAEVSHTLPYDFFEPKKISELDKELKEISGLDWWNKDTLVSIQDENGFLYFISSKDGSILFKSEFGDDGDYEGVAVRKDEVYVLKSNGNVYRIKKPLKKKPSAEKIKTSLSSDDDAEAFCFFEKEKVFLIGAKEYGKHKGKRLIYKLEKGEDDIEEKPYLKIDEKELMLKVHKKYGDRWGNNFKPSGLAIHPISGDLYILSGVNSLLAVFDKNKELIETIRLPKKYATQPEGMCFAPDGTLFISTEGGNGKAKLTKIEMK